MFEKTIILNGKAYLCRELVADDHDAVLKLFHSAKDYFMLSEGQLPEDAEDFFSDLPPGKQADDKRLLGIFDDGIPVAVADIVRDFPEAGIWMTGLLLVHGELRQLGLGKALHNILIDLALKSGARIHRIGVLEQNTAALSFWKKLGFEKVSLSEPRTYGKIETRIVIMHLTIN